MPTPAAQAYAPSATSATGAFLVSPTYARFTSQGRRRRLGRRKSPAIVNAHVGGAAPGGAVIKAQIRSLKRDPSQIGGTIEDESGKNGTKGAIEFVALGNAQPAVAPTKPVPGRRNY